MLIFFQCEVTSMQIFKKKTSTVSHLKDFTTVVISISLISFKPNGISHSYQLIKSISVLRAAGWYFSFLFKL